MKKVSRDLFTELEKAGLIDTTKNFANCYTTCRTKKSSRKTKYVCDQVLTKYQQMLRNSKSTKNNS